MLTIIVIAFGSSGGTGGTTAAPSADSRAQEHLTATRAIPPEDCPSVRHALAFYSKRYRYWTELRVGAGPERAKRAYPDGARSCPRYLVHVWKARAHIARRLYDIWLITGTLRDYPFGDGNHAWHKAVREVQRVFPGTESWLLSCSAAEGGHGRWVGYSGVAYSTSLRDSNTVGGPLQFRFGTFTGMFRRGAEYVRAHGYRLPGHLNDMTTAWRSALGQAIAGGWARYTGNDDSHWSASWSRGC